VIKLGGVMRKNKLYIIFIIMLTVSLFTGCKNNESKASKTMTSYISAVNNKDYEEAYKYLSSYCKDKVPYNKYKDCQEQLSKTVLERNISYGNEEYLDSWVNEDGIEFKNVTKILEKQNIKIYFKNEIISEKLESYRYLIKEGNDYKIIWSGLFTEIYSINYSDVAWQSYDKGKFNDAIEYSNKSLDIWSNNLESYMIKACSNYELRNYKTAIDDINTYISLLEDKEYISKYFPLLYSEEYINTGLSAGYNLKGLLLEFDSDSSGAEKAYEYAINLNPHNESANENLKRLKSKIIVDKYS
jgi:hypothetical protein